MNQKVLNQGLPAALSSWLFLTVLIALVSNSFSAPVVITKQDFTITFPSGWMVVAYPGMPANDSGFNVADTGANEAEAFGYGQKLSGTLTASQIAAIYAKAYVRSFARTDSSNKVLGQYTFTTVGYKDTSSTGDTTSRFRYYITTKGNYAFVSWITYNTDTGPASVSRMESALATLNITILSGIRKFAGIRNPKIPQSHFDAKGRVWEFLPNRNLRTPVFQKP